MHDNRAIVEGRLTRFVRDHLEPAVHARHVPLRLAAWFAPGEPVPAAHALGQHYEPFTVGRRWGAPWSTMWLRVDATVPESWIARPGTRIEAVLDLGFDTSHPGFQAEGMAFDPDGHVIKGISPLNHAVPVDPGPDGSFTCYVEAAANPDIAQGLTFRPTSLGDLDTAGDAAQYVLTRADLVLVDIQTWELLQDVRTLDGLMRELPDTLPRRAEILRALERMLDCLDPDDVVGTAPAGRAALHRVLTRPAYASSHELYAVGHAHIDSAWLWPIRETVRKCARTFSNVLSLMDEQPDFVFACSSAQQLSWIKGGYPELFERIRAKVASGQFVPVGGMWVESDTNMPGGESLARQLLTGKQFFLDEFGVDCEEVWLPDSFGYTGSLPGIMAASGARWFLTQKISWNQTNRMPHHTFWWEGIDGSRIFTHFPPVDKYNSDLSASDLAHAERNFAEQGRATTSLIAYGWGDGGGGPTREMTAVAARTGSLEGSPRVRLADPRDFFIAAQAEYPDAPTWSGELYLESHRGTYTSQARTKQGNRRSEHLLREAELWATTAMVRLGTPYPYDELDRIWRTVLLLQFHDILPGSSIAWVHREAERSYAEVARELHALIDGSVGRLAGEGSLPLTFNATPHERDGVTALGAGAPAVSDHGQAAQLEPREDGGVVLDNGLLRASIDDRGLLVSLIDLTNGREVIASDSPGNLLRLHRDLPNEWDAWDIDEHYRRNVTELLDVQKIEVVEDGADRVTVRISRAFGASTVVQELRLRRGAAALDIATTVDWHERQKLLKLVFGLDVHADRSASEVGFGHVFRPTHANTSWDAAKFEICAHRWIHVAEPGYGVAIANDSTYGHDVTRDTRAGGGTTTSVGLSLLRAPLYPDPDADQGLHTMQISLRPGADVAEAIEEGYRLNLPGRTVLGAHDVAPLLRVSDPAVLIEAVKPAQDRSGDVIVRLYESLGGRAPARIDAAFEFGSVVCTDLVERTVEAPAGLQADGSGVQVELRPFQILTLRFRR